MSELAELRNTVHNELHWITRKTDILTKEECLILLNNKEKYKLRDMYCNCCSLKVSIEDITFYDSGKRSCPNCTRINNPMHKVYDDIEFRALNRVKIEEVENDIRALCDGIKEKIDKEFIKFTERIISHKLEAEIYGALDENTLIQRFFSDFPDVNDTVIDMIYDSRYEELIATTIKGYLIKLGRISRDDILDIYPDFDQIKLKNIQLTSVEVNSLIKQIQTKVFNKKQQIKADTINKMNTLFSNFIEADDTFNKDNAIKRFCESTLDKLNNFKPL